MPVRVSVALPLNDRSSVKLLKNHSFMVLVE